MDEDLVGLWFVGILAIASSLIVVWLFWFNTPSVPPRAPVTVTESKFRGSDREQTHPCTSDPDSAACEQAVDDDYRTQQAEQGEWQMHEADEQRARRAGRYDCSDFASQQEAQEFYEYSRGPDEDIYYLDADRDGVACEWNE